MIAVVLALALCGCGEKKVVVPEVFRVKFETSQGDMVVEANRAWAPHGVRVNALAPGWIETALTAPLWNNQQNRAAIVARTPLGRWGRPQDVGGAALFLASPAAAFITGVVLPVDGGYSIA